MATKQKKTSVPVTAMMCLKNDYMRLRKEPVPLVYAEVNIRILYIHMQVKSFVYKDKIKLKHFSV